MSSKKKSTSKTRSFYTANNKYKTSLCQNSMTFEECHLAILRHAVDKTEKIQKQKIVNDEKVIRMTTILEDFLVKKKLVCYGGIAINNILPETDQFYDKEVEMPDYDFYSPHAFEDAKELADIYFQEGYEEVEAKSGVHYGTFKVFVNFIPMADITYLHPDLYHSIQKDAIRIAGIRYAPPDFLRMNMYLELSRPQGDVSRWEKVLKRLNLLNKHYPLKHQIDCNTVDFQRNIETNIDQGEIIYTTIRDSFIDLNVVFFGGYASSLYSKYMQQNKKQILKKIPDFDVIAEDIQRTADIVKERLLDVGIEKIKMIHHTEVGEVIPKHIEIVVGEDTVAFVYEPIACHNYNQITVDGKNVNIATMDTILSFYLAFYYAKKPYYYRDRILCMTEFLFEVEQRNQLKQQGVLKRFSNTCIGKQHTLEELRAIKYKKYEELADRQDSIEFQTWFMNYRPKKEGMKIKLPQKRSNQSSFVVSNKTKTKSRRSNTRSRSYTSNLYTRKTTPKSSYQQEDTPQKRGFFGFDKNRWF